MGELIQLDLFKSQEECIAEHLLKEIEIIKESASKVRKGTYAKLGNHEKRLMELEQILPIILKGITNGK